MRITTTKKELKKLLLTESYSESNIQNIFDNWINGNKEDVFMAIKQLDTVDSINIIEGVYYKLDDLAPEDAINFLFFIIRKLL